MPLIHSKRPSAFVKNIKSEIKAGKPQKQAVAIAYSVKRDAERKKFAEGGAVHAESGGYCQACGGMCKMAKGGPVPCLADGGQASDAPWWTPQGSSIAQGIANAGKHAEGGEIESPEHEASESGEYEISEMAANELMSAIESKDKEKVVSAMKALVASCMDYED